MTARIKHSAPVIPDQDLLLRAHALWRAGRNTKDISELLRLPEAAVANSLHRIREDARAMR